MNCTGCKEQKDKLFSFGMNDRLCISCLRREAGKDNICPVCGYTAKSQEEQVAMLLTRRNSTPEEKSKAREVGMVVCPECRVVYFDEFN